MSDAPFHTQANVQHRVVCRLAGCGYKSKDTYGSNATAEMSAAYRLATRHLREKHPGVQMKTWIPDDGGKYLIVVVSVQRDDAPVEPVELPDLIDHDKIPGVGSAADVAREAADDDPLDAQPVVHPREPVASDPSLRGPDAITHGQVATLRSRAIGALHDYRCGLAELKALPGAVERVDNALRALGAVA